MCVWLDVYVYDIYVYMRKGYAFQLKSTEKISYPHAKRESTYLSFF